MSYVESARRSGRPAVRTGLWGREGVVPLGFVLAIFVATHVLGVGLSISAASGHGWLAWGFALLTVLVGLASFLALASRSGDRGASVVPVAFAIVAQVALIVVLAVAVGPALRDTYLGLFGRNEVVRVVGQVDDAVVSVRADAPPAAARPVRLGVRTLDGRPVPGGSSVLDMQVPGGVYATYMERVRAGNPPAYWPKIRLWIDPLGIVAPLPVTQDGGVARTSPLLPGGQLLAAAFAGWLLVGATVVLPERRRRTSTSW